MASSFDPHSAAPSAREGSLVANKYRVGKVIGSGGMGVVVAAVHETLGTPVALKVLRPEALLSHGTVGRFLQEARAAALLQSEHVAKVHDFGTLDDGSPFLAMEYLHGRDLSHLLQKRPKLTVSEAVEVLRQTCDALAEAHAAGIVHRDLKPHNLFLVSRPNQALFVKVLDFGIAKMLGSERFRVEITTQSTAMLGTPLYMAPEQLRAAKGADHRSDIWSLGVILHQLLAGEVPFDADSLPELSVKVLTTDAPRLDTEKLHVPEDLADVVQRCLQRDPADRFANVEELMMALDPFVSNRRVSIADLSSPVLDVIATGPRRALEIDDTAFPLLPTLPEAQLGGSTASALSLDAKAAITAKSPASPTDATPAQRPMFPAWIGALVAVGVLAGGAVVFTLVSKAQAPGAAQPPQPASSLVQTTTASVASPVAAAPSTGWAAVPVAASSTPSGAAVEPRSHARDRVTKASGEPVAPVAPPPAASAGPKMGANGAPILAN